MGNQTIDPTVFADKQIGEADIVHIIGLGDEIEANKYPLALADDLLQTMFLDKS